MDAAPPLRTARTADGRDLPVIDLADPRFALPDDPAWLERLQAEYLAAERKRARQPRFLTDMVYRAASGRSALLRLLLNAPDGYLAGLDTYVLKLGEQALPPGYDGAVDRRVAAAPAVVAMRLRLQQVVSLTVQALHPLLAATPGAPLHLLDIAGGPSIDALNAVMMLRRAAPELLDGRAVRVMALDVDSDGPAFGAAALHALMADGAPLAGLDLAMEHRVYDWNDAQALTELLRTLPPGAVMAAMSEGGLFEYGDDRAVAANLRVLREGGVRLVAGSVTRADEARRRLIDQGPFRLKPRGLEGFAPLAREAGFTLARSAPAPLSDQVLLLPV